MTAIYGSLQLQPNEIEDILFLTEWLPPVIFDSHVHTSPFLSGRRMINETATTPGETFNFFDWDLHQRLFRLMFPRQKYVVAAFGFPGLGDWRKDNEYILATAKADDCVAPVLRAEANIGRGLLHDELSQRFVGLKMYPDSRQKKTRARITDVFPNYAFETANVLSKPLVIHLPNGLMNNLEELITLAHKFPLAQFIIAHMGVVYCYESNFEDCLDAVKQCENIFFDTAMVSDSKVIARAIETVGPRRILFGSDAPFSYMRGGYTLDPNGRRRLYSQTKFNWVGDDDRKHYADRLNELKLVHINIVLAIKQALEVLAPESRERARFDIFCHNGKTLFHINR